MSRVPYRVAIRISFREISDPPDAKPVETDIVLVRTSRTAGGAAYRALVDALARVVGSRVEEIDLNVRRLP